MKKFLSIVSIIICIVILYFLCTEYFFKSKEELNCDNNVCEYNFFENTYILDIKKSDTYYYVLSSNSSDNSSGYYYISVIDIFKNKIVNKKEFDTNDIKNISLINYNNKVYTYILGNDSFDIYNDLFEVVDNVKVGDEYYGYILPYNNTYLYNVENKVLDINDKEIINEKRMYYNSYFVNDIPIYLFYDLDNDSGVIHILNDSKDELHINNNNMSVNIYENGLYYPKDNRFSLYDVNTNTTYQSNIEYSYDSIVGKDYAAIYEGNNINIYNLRLNTKNYSINDKINDDNLVNLKYMNDKYLFYTLSDSSILFVADYTKNENINEEVILKDDKYYKKLNSTIVKDIKDKYNVTIKLYDEATKYFPDFYAIPIYDEAKIYNSLKTISEVISKFPKEFFDKFHVNDKNGIVIYIDKSVGSSDINTQISNPAAYSNEFEDEYTIAISIENSDLDVLICHELMHQIENNLDDISKETFYTKDWNKLNPKNFSYENSYVTNPDNKYTLESDIPYFIDTYAKTFPSEDRARIFERVCSNKYIEDINKNEKILAKAKYIEEIIVKAYPSLLNSDLFKNIN